MAADKQDGAGERQHQGQSKTRPFQVGAASQKKENIAAAPSEDMQIELVDKGSRDSAHVEVEFKTAEGVGEGCLDEVNNS